MIDDTNIGLHVPGFDFVGYIRVAYHFIMGNETEITGAIQSTAGWIIGLSIPISLALFIGILYCLERIHSIRRRQEEKYNAPVDMGFDEVTPADDKFTKKWQKVLEHVESDRENDWRQAILEADILLGELLVKLGYKGEGIGEQLQRVNKGDFKSLNEAWDAHKVRNNVAHEGSELSLTHHEARRVIGLYRKVFEEFSLTS